MNTAASEITQVAKCPECGNTFTPHHNNQTFCTTGCQYDWNNRRKRRGAQLYDLFMEMRTKREKGTGHYKAMCRLVSMWREEDLQENRQTSWNDPNDPKNPNRALLLGTTVYRPR
jgi:hypothetical protein